MAGKPELAQKFLEAALEPERWLEALGHLADATGSDRAQLIGFGRRYDVGFNWVTNSDPGMFAALENVEGEPHRTNFRIAANLGAGANEVLHEAHYDAVRPTLASDNYVDFCRDWEIPHGCQTNLHQSPDELLGMALLRSEANGRTNETQRAVFVEAARYATAAAGMQRAIEHQGHRLIANTFEAMDAACFVLDARLKVCALSPAADALLAGGMLELSDGRVSAPDPDAARHLTLAYAGLGEKGALARHVLLHTERGAIGVRLHRLPVRDWTMGFAPYAILVVKPMPGTGPADLALLRDGYRLTLAEAEIALLLVGGQERDRICELRGISRETLRSHLRALFGKLGVRREVEAVRVLHGLLG